MCQPNSTIDNVGTCCSSHNHSNESYSKTYQILLGAIIFILALTLPFSDIWKMIFFIVSYLILGTEIILTAIKNILKGDFFDENFLMSLATIAAFIIGEYPEAVGVMLFFQIGEYFQNRAVSKSKKSISELVDLRPEFVNLITKDKSILKVKPESINIGDKILVHPGEKIPLDGKIIHGETYLDLKNLTGESLPQFVHKDSQVLSGSINQTSPIEIEVSKIYEDSTVSKILNLVQNASQKKSKTENFITKFSKYYTPIVILLALLLAIIPIYFFQGESSVWIYRSLVFLVISCPCALVVSIPLSFFAGIGKASKNGILIKGTNYLEALNRLEAVAFDKTGTLTEGSFKIQEIIPQNGITEEELLEKAAYGECYSHHPIALSLKNSYSKEINPERIKNYKEIAGLGIEATLDDKIILVGNERLMKERSIDFSKSDSLGQKIYIAENQKFLGTIIISDTIKSDAKKTIQGLHTQNISTFLLTGDHKDLSESIAKSIGVTQVYSQLLPQDKESILSSILKKKSKDKTVAFIGDGINDAPVLMSADIGIAMGGLGRDAAIEASDVVFMNDAPSKILTAIEIARKTRKIVNQNIVFILLLKFTFLSLGALGIANMWQAVFADVGVTLLAILNSLRILR